MTITLTPEQRDAIRAVVLTDLSVIGNIYLAIEDGEWDEAKRYRSACEELMLLLDDLGWEPEQAGQVQLRVPADRLLPVITKLLENQIDVAADSAEQWQAQAAASDVTCRALADVETALGGPRTTWPMDD